MAETGVVTSVFYGYSAKVIAEWCGVSIETAKHWKRGGRHPSLSAAKLFALYRNGKVLGAEWNEWQIKDGLLVDPEGNQTTQGQLRAYYLIYQLCNELSHLDPVARKRIERIMLLAV